MYISASNGTEKRINEYKDLFLSILNIEQNLHTLSMKISQKIGYAYLFVTYLREIIYQKVNILMKSKINTNLNRKCEIKSHFAFLSIT